MIEGKGLLATAFRHFAGDEDVLVFASGVSNSSATDEGAFRRESDLLHAFSASGRLLVYFSTTSIFDRSLQHSPYIIHKKNMEALIRGLFSRHLILRLPNVVGVTPNPHTLTNFLRDRIMSGEPFEVHSDSCRYLIDADDVARIGAYLISEEGRYSSDINAAWPQPLYAAEIVKLMEEALGKEGVHTPVRKGDCYPVDNAEFLRILSDMNLHWDVSYYAGLIRKYYATH